MRHFKKHFYRYRKEIATAPLFKFIETATEIIIPMLIANMIDIGVANHDEKYVLTYGAIVVGLNVLGIIVAIICQKLAAKAATGISAGIRYDMYVHINSFSHNELDKFSTASINNRITHDVDRVRIAIGMFIRMVMRTPFLLIGSIVMAMIIDLKLSLIFLVVAPLVIGVVFLIMKLTVPLYDRSQKDLDRVGNVTRENLEGSRVVRAFNKQDVENKRFMEETRKLKKSSLRVASVSSLLNPATSIIINLAIVVILWYGGIEVNVGGLKTGQIIAFINYLTQISAALVSVANVIIAFIKAFNCGKRINEILDTKPTIVTPQIVSAGRNADGILTDNVVEFNNVTFTYKGAEKPAFAGLNLKVKRGQTIGIIGGTGSGKSSVMYMVPRFYDATEGVVLVDGLDVKNYELTDLRSRIGIVPQRSVLFSGTLRENMQWHKANASDEEIMKALDVAQATDFVKELEGGLDFRVQAGGKNFSGGQRQRLAIARALVGDPEILIMDDSSSALDYVTDLNLRKAIKDNTRDLTVFIVSQRINTIRNADSIVVLDKGRIVGIGDHKTLVKECKVYNEIFLSQSK